MRDSVRETLLLFASHGFTALYVQELLEKFEGVTMSLGTIYRTASREGLSFWDYRRGKTKSAKAAVQNLRARSHLRIRRVA